MSQPTIDQWQHMGRMFLLSNKYNLSATALIETIPSILFETSSLEDDTFVKIYKKLFEKDKRLYPLPPTRVPVVNY